MREREILSCFFWVKYQRIKCESCWWLVFTRRVSISLELRCLVTEQFIIEKMGRVLKCI